MPRTNIHDGRDYGHFPPLPLSPTEKRLHKGNLGQHDRYELLYACSTALEISDAHPNWGYRKVWHWGAYRQTYFSQRVARDMLSLKLVYGHYDGVMEHLQGL